MLRYSLLRVLLFFAVAAVLWLLGLREQDEMIALIGLSAIISLVMSIFVLRPFRNEASTQLAHKLEARRDKMAVGQADNAAEDAEIGATESGDPRDAGDFR